MSKSSESQPFRRTRHDHASEIAEDYVEAIADLIQSQGACRVRDLASRFGVTHVTVVRTIQRLERDGLVSTEPYKPVQLTTQGQQLADECQERHRLVYEFLRAIGVSEQTATVDAEGIEHHVSPETLGRFQSFINKQQ